MAAVLLSLALGGTACTGPRPTESPGATAEPIHVVPRPAPVDSAAFAR